MTRHDMPRSWDPVRNFVSSACQSLLKSPWLRWTKRNFWGRICLLSQKMSYATDVFTRSWSALY